jgi:uncharacterized phage protein gp47/JayE
MPWTTPTLKETRRLTRDYVLSQLGAKAMIPNSVLRIMSDAKAALTHLTFLYLDWLAKQLLPDTAETEWLDRHGIIWLENSDGSKGRKAATFANGSVQFTGVFDTIIPTGTLLSGSNVVDYQTVVEGRIGMDGFGNAEAVSLVPGEIGNLPVDGELQLVTEIIGIETATVPKGMVGGVEAEPDHLLRERILFRIQNPPMGGSQADYVRWATAVPGVTRAWAASELGAGSITVRFLMDDKYPDNFGLPSFTDISIVEAYINKKRPVTVKDCYVLAPLLQFYEVNVLGLVQDTATVRASIEASIKDMEFRRSKPGQTMYRSWVDEAVSQAVGEETHELGFTTVVMPGPGYMPVMGDIHFGDY